LRQLRVQIVNLTLKAFARQRRDLDFGTITRLSQAACVSGTSAVTHTLFKSASWNSMVPG